MLFELLETSCDAFAGPLTWEWEAPLRAVVALLFAFLFVSINGRRATRWLGRFCAEPIRTSSSKLNEILSAKRATPTMGGLLVWAAFLTAVCISGCAAGELWFMLAVTGAYTIPGACDDWIKLTTIRKGMSARSKLFIQIVLAAIPCALWYGHVHEGDLIRTLPWHADVNLGVWAIPIWTLFLVGFSNAVNLTDGLDGLAAGSAVFVTVAILCLCVVLGDRSELLVVAAALLGSLLGFLRFNRHPARMFMGNTGSLPLGALLAAFGIVLKREMLLVPLGAVFVVETLSVILQVGFYRWRNRRLFRCAPLHHHFQFLGWDEKKIVRRFWWAGATSCAVSVLLELATVSRGRSQTINSVRVAQELNTIDELRLANRRCAITP